MFIINAVAHINLVGLAKTVSIHRYVRHRSEGLSKKTQNGCWAANLQNGARAILCLQDAAHGTQLCVCAHLSMEDRVKYLEDVVKTLMTKIQVLEEEKKSGSGGENVKKAEVPQPQQKAGKKKNVTTIPSAASGSSFTGETVAIAENATDILVAPGGGGGADAHLNHYLRATPGVAKWLLPALFAIDTRCGFVTTFPARIAGGHVCLTVDMRQLATVARACSGGERVTISGCKDAIKNLMSHHNGPALVKVDSAMQKTARNWLPFASDGVTGREWAYIPVELLARLYRIVSNKLEIPVLPEDLMKSRDLVCEWTTKKGFTDRPDVPSQRKILLGVEASAEALVKVMDPLRTIVKALHGPSVLPKDNQTPFHVGPMFRPLHHHHVRKHGDIILNVKRPIQAAKVVPTPRKRQLSTGASSTVSMHKIKVSRLDVIWPRDKETDETPTPTSTTAATHTPSAELESML